MPIPQNPATVGASTPARGRKAEAFYRYSVYGVVLASDMRLSLPVYRGDRAPAIACTSAPARVFDAALREAEVDSAPGWYRAVTLSDGSTYVRWAGVGEFIVAAEGGRVVYRRMDGASLESIQVYMLVQALSFALVRQGHEPLHATTIAANGRAVAFLGGNGFGKSTLAASCLAAGCGLLTDDLLLVDASGPRTVALPGPPRIKLFARTARQLGAEFAAPSRMNPETDKIVVAVDGARAYRCPATLSAIYALAPPAEACRAADVRVDALSPRDAVAALLGATFDRRCSTPERLTRQLRFVGRLADRVPVKRLTYRRSLAELHLVRAAVLGDLA